MPWEDQQLEAELKKALQRQDPSPGFAARVAARAEASQAETKVVRMPRRGWQMAWAAGIAAMLTVGVVVNSEYRERQAEHEAQQARIALRITAEKINMARAKVLAIAQRHASQTEN